MFGDIVKVTPSSKVVGDMAIFMVSHGLTEEQVLDPDHPVAFPDSVVAFFHGDLGQPPGGFPKALQKKILRGDKPIEVRPGSLIEAVDIPAVREEAEHKLRRGLNDRELASYLLYPQVFLDYAEQRRSHGNVALLPTPVFFYGPQSGEEFNVEIGNDRGYGVRAA